MASLHETVLAQKIEDHVQSISKQNSNAGQVLKRRSTVKDMDKVADLMKNLPAQMGNRQAEASAGVASAMEANWSRMNGSNLTAAQQAELAHVRNMIDSLTKSLEQYKKAENEILNGGK